MQQCLIEVWIKIFAYDSQNFNAGLILTHALANAFGDSM